MTTKVRQAEKDVVFFITITCHNWMPLFDTANCYDTVYNWFNVLKKNKNKVLGYVLMPNHFHALIHVDKDSDEINKLVANGKRFMAYDVVKRLDEKGLHEVLFLLEKAVQPGESVKGKLHQVFEPSFDCKPCYDKKFLEQKLDYIHRNPCSGKWNLADEFTGYKHSSAAFYELDETGGYGIDDYRLTEW